MAEDLEARAKALGASDRARRQLLADVSHELMTPLTAIRGYTETLGMSDLQLDDATRGRYLAIIGDETLKLEELIGDLLELARLEGGGGTLAFKDVAISDLFGRVVDRHGPTIREREITIERRIEPADLEVRGDPQRLEQALQNLASNALRHTPEGGTIRLSASATADGVHITGRGLWRRHPAGAPAPRVRSLLQSRSVEVRRRSLVREWSGPLDRAGDCRAARRQDHGDQCGDGGRRGFRNRAAGAAARKRGVIQNGEGIRVRGQGSGNLHSRSKVSDP